MKFYLDSKKYFYRDEFNKSFMLMSLITNQTFELSADFRPLISYSDKWVEFDYFYQIVSLISFDTCKRSDLETLIYRLHTSGILYIEDFPQSELSGIRLAKPTDYHNLANFCRQNYNKGYSQALYCNADYYQDPIFFSRLHKMSDLMVIDENNGTIEAVLICSRNEHYFGNELLTLKSFIFAEDLSEAECREKIAQLTDFLARQAKGKLRKIRYEQYTDEQEFIVENLLKNGFKKTAFFPKGYDNKIDITLYDRFL